MPKISAVATMDRDESKFASNAIELMTGMGPSTSPKGEFRVGKLGAGEGVIYFMDPKAKGFNIIAQRSFKLSAGESLDLGEIHGARADSVPEDKRGTLGMETTIASVCPLADEEEKAASAEDESAGEKLWIIMLVKDGPAESAGAKICDQVTIVNGMDGEVIGAQALQQVLRMGLEAGQTSTVAVNRKSGPTTLSILIAPEEDEDDE
jgi:hypothetical protein